MPDYNRPATVLWCLVVGAGALVLAMSLLRLGMMPPLTWLQVAGGLALTLATGLFPVRVPGNKSSFVAGEIFIFLMLLLLGPAAATVVAACEAAVGSWRTSKRWTSRLFSPASAALAMASTGSLLWAVQAALARHGLDGAAPQLAAVLGFSALYFLTNLLLVSGVQRLKRNESFVHWVDLLSVFRWVGLAYAGSASVAALLALTLRQHGAGVLVVMLPLLALLVLTLHFYFRRQEASLAMDAAGAELAQREAALAEREAAAAERHLKELRASERRFHSAFTHASIGMALMAFDGRMLQANPALAAVLGVPEAALAQQRFQQFVMDEDRAVLDEQLGAVDGHEFQGFSREVRCRHADGSTVWLALHCSFFTDPDADTPCLILQAQDVSARRRAEAGLQHMAFHDSLTGLANRRRFMECLAGAVARSRTKPAHRFAVMFLDFDRFKLVNDSLGHNAGDDLLQQMARRLQEKLRPHDVLARLGGDEFAILLDRIEHEHDAVVLAERLMAALREPFMVGAEEITGTASIGITFSAFGYDRAEDVLRDADTAMYKAKGAGRAQFAVFDSSLHAAVSERLRLEGELRHAIERGQLKVVYQPVFDLGVAGSGAAGGVLSGFEALVRWQHPQDGTLVPAAFLPIAEESGLMTQLTDFVLHCACRQLALWQQQDPSLPPLAMNVNLSAHDLAHPALVARVSRALVEAGLQPAQLTLELTENILMSHVDGAVQTLAALRKLGVHLAVDDFGTGYSSLSHLARLPIDSLKIDRSFVSHLQPGSDDAAVVGAIIQLGGTLRKRVVAEGIESQSQMQQLQDMGCRFGQGFHLAAPLSERAAGEWLQNRRGMLH